MVTYAATCLALLRLRQRDPGADAWRAPAGRLLALFGIGFAVMLALRMTPTHAVIMGVVVVVATGNWLVVRNRAPPPSGA